MKYKNYDIEIIRKNNKHTYLRVKKDLKIYITTSYFTSKKEIKKLIDDNIEYIEKMFKRQLRKKEYDSSFRYLGKKYELLENLSEKEINNWYKKQAKRIFKERLDIVFNSIEEDIPYPNLTIRKMTSRWGVCNRRLNKITLNLELIKKEYKYIDYVIIHELVHFLFSDHSKNFWDKVSKYEKNYKRLRKELNDYKC